MNKPVLFYLIDDMLKGGAETLLAGILAPVSERYAITLVTLGTGNAFPEAIGLCQQHLILPYRGLKSIPTCVLALRRAIRQQKPMLIHAHLFMSSLIGRMACPRQIPFVQTLHSMMSEDVFHGNRLLTWMEKSTLRKRHIVIGVSKPVLEDYHRTIRVTSTDFVLPNFVDDQFLQAPVHPPYWNGQRTLQLVAVGNIKPLKNYGFLLEAIERSPVPVSLDIYGKDQANLLPSLIARVEEQKLPVRFMGLAEIHSGLLQQYDALILPSIYEGFGIAAVEAMASGLPVLVSKLPVLEAVTGGHALYFDPLQPDSLTELWQRLFQEPAALRQLAEEGCAFVRSAYSREQAVTGLLRIYQQVTK